MGKPKKENTDAERELIERMREESEGIDQYGDEKENHVFGDEPSYVE